jgi:hypothetical protein
MAEKDGLFAIAFALLQLAHAQQSIATHIKYLGTGDAATTMGAIEFLGAHVGMEVAEQYEEIRPVRELLRTMKAEMEAAE